MNFLRVIATIALLIVVIGIVYFAVINPDERVTINLWTRTFEDIPLILALFIAFVLGVVLTLLYTLYYFIDLWLTVRRLKKRNRMLENELVALRNLQIEEPFEVSKLEDRKDVSL